MKRYFSLILDFIFVLFFGVFIGILFFILSFESTHLIAGRTLHLSKDILTYAYLLIVPFVLLIIPCAMMLYKTRHRKNPVGSFICYTILVLVIWMGLFPLHFIVSNKLLPKIVPYEQLDQDTELSKGYFRTVNDETHYYLEDSVDNSAYVVTIDSKSEPERVPFFHNIDISKEIEPYNDPLVKFSMQDTSFSLVSQLQSLFSTLLRIWNKNFLAWLCILSFAFALASPYAFIRISSWRLINSFCCLMGFIFVLGINILYFYPQFDSIRSSLYELFYGHGTFSFFSKNELDAPLFFLNLIIGFIFSISGILIFTVKNKGNK